MQLLFSVVLSSLQSVSFPDHSLETEQPGWLLNTSDLSLVSVPLNSHLLLGFSCHREKANYV